ncbi:MAG TPA: DHH family phosphoesterase [Methanomassiliicoccales archaeon]|jgi:RecJ-like exonuclease
MPDTNEEHRDLAGFDGQAKEIADFLLTCKKVTVVGHIDADGITATSIAFKSLQDQRMDVKYNFIKKIDENEIKRINKIDSDGVLLVDLGSGYASRLEHPGLCIADHHEVDPVGPSRSRRKGQVSLLDFDNEGSRHLNPHLFGFDGSKELSGAGAAYAIAKAMDGRNRNLAHLAIVGAVGDFQDSSECRLIGLNRRILEDAETVGSVRSATDVRYFGRETRPLVNFLRYSSDPRLPRLTNEEDMCYEFLREQGIPLKEDGHWRCWADLRQEEKDRIVAVLKKILAGSDQGPEAASRLMGEVYSLVREEPRTVMHDAKEFATLLNSCGRYEKAPTGLEVCIKGPQLKREKMNALRNLQNHRDNLKGAIEMVKGKDRVVLGSVQYLRNGEGSFCLPVEDTVVGIVAGMLLGSGDIPCDRPLIAFALSVDENNVEMTKVSARGTKELVEKGLDLSSAMRRASESVGGTGGGHNIAAGATIPQGREDDFLAEIDRIIGAQLG